MVQIMIDRVINRVEIGITIKMIIGSRMIEEIEEIRRMGLKKSTIQITSRSIRKSRR